MRLSGRVIESKSQFGRGKPDTKLLVLFFFFDDFEIRVDNILA